MADKAQVFANPDFWRSPRWPDQPRRTAKNEFFQAEFSVAEESHGGELMNQHVDKPTSEEFFALPPPLQPLVINGLERDEEVSEEERPETEPTTGGLHDIDILRYACPGKDELPAYIAEYKSWDGFDAPDLPVPSFITEAGPAAYDAALDSAEDPFGLQNQKHRVVQTERYVASLSALALGRASVLFAWDDTRSSFKPEIDKMRISGLSADVLAGLQNWCLRCGNISRYLATFVHITYRARPSAGRVALAKAIDSVLLAIQGEFGGRAKDIKSLLQLWCLVQPVHSVLTYFRSLLANLKRARTDEHMLSLLHDETQALQHGNTLLGHVMREVLARVSEPWMDFVQEWIGLRAEEGTRLTKGGSGKSFVRVENVPFVDDLGVEGAEPDFILDVDRMPNFVPEDIAQTMFETGRNLRLLRDYHAAHLLCRPELARAAAAPDFTWQFTWTSVETLRAEVNKYEASLLRAIHSHPSSAGQGSHVAQEQRAGHSGYAFHLYGQEEGQLADRLLASIKTMDQAPASARDDDTLSTLLHSRLFDSEQGQDQLGIDFNPHWSLLPFLSFGPLVSAQARLVNRELMKLLFSAHGLREHLNLQREFHLLGNGFFCSRLSHALFDADLETAERQSGVAMTGAVMGLRLGSRDTWPPASSELRLALMGVLIDSYHPTTAEKALVATNEGHLLPGDLSFAVRDLSEEEIDKCMDSGSLEALDFLRLSYKPPAPLCPIFTPVIRVKYDKIFKMLLRIMRMLFVANDLFRDTNLGWHMIDQVSLRFRHEAHHFITSIAAYFFDTGMVVPWRRFELWLDGVESDMAREDYDTKAQRVPSPDDLRERHEQVLDQIMHTLLLRKRQQPVLSLLEEIFTIVLTFSKRARLEAVGDSKALDGMLPTRELYGAFKKKVDIFITVCRGLSEKGGRKTSRKDIMTAGKPQAVEDSTVDQLLLRLDMSGYYRGPHL